MAVTATLYGKAALHLGTGDFNLTSDTLKVALAASSYTPNADTHEFFSDVTNESTGTGYTAGGATLASVGFSYDSGNHWAALTANPVTWSATTVTARYAIVYKSTGTAGTSPLLFWVNFGADEVPGGVDLTINWSNGLLHAYGV